MKSKFLKFIQFLAVIFTVLLILLALIIAVVRAAAPVVAQEVPAIEAYLSQKLHKPVEIHAVSLQWQGIIPTMAITDLDIYTPDKTQKIFSVHKIFMGAYLFHSLWYRTLLLKYLFVEGVHLTVEHDKTGKWEIQGLSALMNSPAALSPSASSIKKSLKFSGKNLSVMIPGVFPQAVFLQSITTRLMLNPTPQGLQIALTHLQANNQDAAMTGNIAYSSGEMNLRLEYQLFPAFISHIDNYLPQNLLHPALIHWLDNAVRKLSGGQGSFILQGNLKDFPYTSQPGQFLVTTQLKGLTLRYDPAWPDARDVDGTLIFHANTMVMDVKKIKIETLSADHLEAVIPALGEDSVLNIQGNVSTTAPDLLDFIQHSPLKKTVGKYFEGYTWTGPSQLQLKLTIPLTPHAKSSSTRVAGKLLFNQNKFSVSSNTALEKMKGEIDFNESGLTGKSLSGLVENTPFTATISANQYRVNYGQWRLIFNNRRKDTWQVNVSYPQLAGILSSQNGLSHIAGQFKYIYITDDNKLSSFKQVLSPDKIPSLNIIINDFRYGNKRFGQIKFKTSPFRNGLKLENLQSDAGAANIQMNGQWIQNAAQSYSAVSGKFTTKNLSETLSNWGLSPSIRSASANAAYNFNWPGSLYSPDIKNLEGNIHFEIDKGEILNVSSEAKMGMGHLLTLLSVQSLAKRLTLDFSDISLKGLNFDSIKGNFQLNQGIASTQNTQLRGPITGIKMTGDIDLVNETYNLKLVVTPHLTSSLPMIAAIAGGPVIGAAAWAANKLFNPVINKITRDNYTITGPWDKPVIK